MIERAFITARSTEFSQFFLIIKLNTCAVSAFTLNLIIMTIRNYITPILIFFLYSISTAEQFDFFIIDNPSGLSILNQYEQPLTDAEKRELPARFPLQITDSKSILGDQITEAIRCLNNGNTFFLLRNDNGNFKGSNKLSYNRISGCTPLGDTVTLTEDVFITPTLTSSHGIKLVKGSTVLRVFQKSPYVFLFSIGQNRQYGWCSRLNIYKKTEKSQVKTAEFNTTDVLPAVKKRLEAANTSYRNIFSFFNDLTKQEKNIPFWEVTDNGKDSFKCTLRGSRQTIAQMESSTKYVVQDIEQMLLGKPFRVNFTDNIMTITRATR